MIDRLIDRMKDAVGSTRTLLQFGTNGDEIDWLIDLMIDWLIDLLIDWMIDWKTLKAQPGLGCNSAAMETRLTDWLI